MIACQKGYIDAVKILHVYHADVNKKDMVRGNISLGYMKLRIPRFCICTHSEWMVIFDVCS